VSSVAYHDICYKKISGTIPHSNISSSFAMEHIKTTTVHPSIMPRKTFRLEPYFLPFVAFLFALLLGCKIGFSNDKLELIELPAGFNIELYASGVHNARAMALGPKGTLFVGSRSAGNVYGVVDVDNDKKGDEVLLIATNLRAPSGVAVSENSLYVSAVNKILRFDNIENQLNEPPLPVLVTNRFPNENHHGSKFIDFGPDGSLYVPVGAPCNVCLRSDPYASILRMNKDGSNMEVFARGVRNSVGFAWHPKTGEFWFTDNGRDNLGDDIPPGELNRAHKLGLHFGFPFCHGTSISDPRFGHAHTCAEFQAPEQLLGPHVAPLGITFYEGDMFPDEYNNSIFIAEHGSWNREEKIGYRITVVQLDNKGNPKSYKVFASGWLQHQKSWGRPTDVLVLNDGSLLVSDDKAGAIYRIFYVRP
jgi:glucose/arabinose dehydrogenase